MKNVKKLLTSVLLAFALLLIAPIVLPGYNNIETVNAAPKTINLFKGYKIYSQKSTLAASGLTWYSSNTGIATVKELYDANGKTTLQIDPVAAGTCEIKYKKPNGSSVTQYKVNVITVSRTSGVRTKNGSYTLSLKGITGEHTVKWSVSDSSKLSLSSASKTSVKVTGKAAGTAYVYATINGSKRACTKIKVEELAISKGEVGLTKGNTYTLKVLNKASGVATTRTVTWSSSNASVASVSSAGKVTAVSAGTAKIYASIGGVKFVCDVTVKNTPTSADYMLKLKETIQKSSKVNKDGYHYIYRGAKSGTATYKYYVVYMKDKDCLKFYFERKDSDSKRAAKITMYVKKPGKSYKTTPSLTLVTKTGIKYKTKRTFDYRTYSNTKDEIFQITYSNKKLTDAYKASFQENSNNYLQYAMKGWNTLLTKNGFTMKQIGFTNF